jgi:hypothetical protein
VFVRLAFSRSEKSSLAASTKQQLPDQPWRMSFTCPEIPNRTLHSAALSVAPRTNGWTSEIAGISSSQMLLPA